MLLFCEKCTIFAFGRRTAALIQQNCTKLHEQVLACGLNTFKAPDRTDAFRTNEIELNDSLSIEFFSFWDCDLSQWKFDSWIFKHIVYRDCGHIFKCEIITIDPNRNVNWFLVHDGLMHSNYTFEMSHIQSIIVYFIYTLYIAERALYFFLSPKLDIIFIYISLVARTKGTSVPFAICFWFWFNRIS